MSFMQVGHAWSTGYAIPEYVRAEPPGRGTFTTKWMPRGTIPGLVTDFLAKPAGKKLTGRTDVHLGLGAEVYELVPTGASEPLPQLIPGDPQDPIRQYGESAAAFIMSDIRKLPESDRKNALRLLLDAIDQSLWSAVSQRAEKFESSGMPAKKALQKALMIAFANQLGTEIVRAGKTGARTKGLLSPRGPSALSGVGSTIGGWLGTAWDKLSSGACKVLTNPLAPAAAAGVASAEGVPPQVGAAGTMVAASMCASDQTGVPATGVVVSSTPSWLLPAAIGGGVLILALALR